MMHAKSESDVASIAASSSPASPKRPVYFVQSPSRDSHDDVDKSSSSVQATPNYHSPLESPSHPSSSFGRHSRSSSSSRVSGNWRWTRGNRRRSGKGWQECNVIEEEVDYDDMYGDQGFTRRCKCLLAVMGLGAIFAVFCLIIWGASRPYKPQISMKSFKVYNFYFGQGSDRTGVPTKLLTVNCSVSIVIYNPATYFGIHVSSDPVNLIYSELTVATGQLKKYYQPRKSRRIMSANLEGQRVPLYGAGATFAALDVNGEVPMKLDFELQSQGNLVGKLVRTKHLRHISCSLVINSRSTKETKFKPDSCTYD